MERGLQVNVVTLKQQHQAIRDAVQELVDRVDQPCEESLPHIAKARMKLARAVSTNMASETAEIHEPLQRHRITSHIPAYAGIADKTRELRLVFSAHIAKWSTSAIRDDWLAYGGSVKSITEELVDVLAREECDLFHQAQTLLRTLNRSL
jgi:23S rRNA pseudoU1915 N3-methylase RlmH